MVKIRKVYDVYKFYGEENDGISETVTTGYIPINEQVKMIMRGEITVGVGGFDNAVEDIDAISPEEFFEDATDYNTESELQELYVAETSKKSAGNSEPQQDSQENAIKATTEEERTKLSDDDVKANI